MWSVQKRDFMSQWVEIYRASQFEDANRFKKGVGGGKKTEIRIIQI